MRNVQMTRGRPLLVYLGKELNRVLGNRAKVSGERRGVARVGRACAHSPGVCDDQGRHDGAGEGDLTL